MSAAVHGYGTLLRVTAADLTTYATVAEVREVAPPELSTDSAEVTNHSSASAHRERIATLRDTGVLGASINYLPANATHGVGADGILGLWQSRATRLWRVIHTDGAATPITFSGFVSKFQSNPDLEGPLTADIEVTAVGAPTLA